MEECVMDQEPVFHHELEWILAPIITGLADIKVRLDLQIDIAQRLLLVEEKQKISSKVLYAAMVPLTCVIIGWALTRLSLR
jgi:hypothetical protein